MADTRWVVLKIFGKEKKLLITDVDGVLLDITACFDKNLPNAAEEMGLDPAPAIQYIKDVRSGQRNPFSNIDDNIQNLWPDLDECGRQKFKKVFIENEEKNPYPAVPGSSFAILFFQRHMRVALCTTNRRDLVIPRLMKVGFEMSWFSFISSWETGHLKPDPRALTIITDSLKISKENSLFVGDFSSDWECAQKAGIEFVAVLSGGIPKHAFLREGIQEDHILNDLFDVYKLSEL